LIDPLVRIRSACEGGKLAAMSREFQCSCARGGGLASM